MPALFRIAYMSLIVILLAIIGLGAYMREYPISLSACYDTFNTTLTSKLNQMQQEKWGKEEACKSSKQAIDTLNSCITSVTNNYPGAIFIQSRFDKRFVILTDYNTSCNKQSVLTD